MPKLVKPIVHIHKTAAQNTHLFLLASLCQASSMLPPRMNYLELLALRYESVFSDLLLLCWIVFEKCEGQTESSSKVQKARNSVAVSMFLTTKDHLWEGTSGA